MISSAHPLTDALKERLAETVSRAAKGDHRQAVGNYFFNVYRDGAEDPSTPAWALAIPVR